MNGVIFISKTFLSFFIILIILIVFISVFFTPILFGNSSGATSNGEILDFNPNGFVWPTPGYTRINSYFGKRNAPTAGASTFHKGIDIGAPEGSYFIAVCDGEITFANFLGGGGYTITLTAGNLKISYCHCNPDFIVHVGDVVKQGQIIGNVGPKYVYGVPGNQYKDSSGNPTNGATTGPHLHLGIRKDGEYVNPLDFF